MFHKSQYIVGFVRAHARHSLKAQRAAMDAVGVAKLYEEDLELLIKQRREGEGDVVAVTDASLLADPAAKRKKGGLRADFYRVIDALHLKGVTIWELSTNYISSDARQRELMNRKAIETMARTRKYDKIGRPPKVWSDGQREIIAKHWFSNRHATNRLASEAMLADGVRCSPSQAAKLLGPSKRTAGNPIYRAMAVKKRAGRSVVYFLQRKPPTGPVKIGWTCDVSRRIPLIQSGSAERLVLIGTVPGQIKLEGKMHRRFAELRIGGEWFKCKGKLAAFLEKLKQK